MRHVLSFAKWNRKWGSQPQRQPLSKAPMNTEGRGANRQAASFTLNAIGFTVCAQQSATFTSGLTSS